MSRVERSRREKVTRYSVRKVSFGAASVAVAAFFMFLGNGAVYAAEPNVTATDSALAATPANNQLDENSGSSEATAPKAQADTTTPTPADASSTSVESATVSKAQADTTASKPADATPAPVVSSTTSTTEETPEKATPALDKKQLEDYVAEIDAKLASGSYATKTDESVATLKEHLGLAKLALTTAKSQDELTKAYRRLFMTVNSGLRSKPKAQVESPKLDTTEGKATVGKKASNTEKATGTNSIANSGQHDPRNRQALDRNNPFRTDATTTDTDPSANQTYTAPSADASVNQLAKALQDLPDKVENNDKISKNMDNLGASKKVSAGQVLEIDEFGGWKAVGENGKFVIARKTTDGVFPLETINSTLNDIVWLTEQAFDRTSDYTLLLSKSRTRANMNDVVADGSAYKESGEGRGITKNVVNFKGIEKVFKAYSTELGTNVVVKFKTGYAGDSEGKKANYKVEVFSIAGTTETKVYETTFDPQEDYNDKDKVVTKANDGTHNSQIRISNTSNGFVQGQTKTRQDFIGKEAAEKKIAEPRNVPNGTPGTFTSRNIELPKGVEKYKVRISLANQNETGMSYQAWDLKYSLPITGLDFTITQDTNKVAKSLLQRVYDKLKETEAADTKGKTETTINAYKAQLENVKNLLAGDLKATQDYKKLVTDVLTKQAALRTDKSGLTTSKRTITDLIDETPEPTSGKTPSSVRAYTAAKEEAKKAQAAAQAVLDKDNPSSDEVELANSKLNEKIAELRLARAELATAATDAQKAELKKVDEALATANLDGKTPKSVEAYNKEIEKLQAELDTAKHDAKAVVDKGEEATKAEASEAQVKVAEVKAKLVEASKLLKAKPAKTELTTAKTELDELAKADVATADKTTSTKTAYDAAKTAAEEAVTEATAVINNEDATPEEVAEALAKVKAKKAALETAKAGLVDKITDAQKAELKKVDEALATANLDGKTPKSVEAYNKEIEKLQAELDTAKHDAKAVVDKGEEATKAEASEAQVKVAEVKAKLVEASKLLKAKPAKTELTTAKTELDELAKADVATADKTTSTKTAYDAAKTAAEEAVTEATAVINNEDATPEEVAEALAKVKAKKAALETAKAGLVDKITDAQKAELANADEDLKLADKTGKTNDSIKAYNDEVSKLSADLEAAKQAAKELLAKGDNAGELEAYRLQAKISKLKSKLATAAKLLKDIDKSAVKKEVEEAAKNATDAIESNVDLPAGKKAEAKAKVAEEANKSIAAIDDATTEDDVTAAKDAGKLAIAKEAAKAALEAAQAIKEKVIAGNEKLSDDEKQAVKEQVQNVVDEAKKAIDAATEQVAVDNAKTTGKEAIDALNPVGKEKALDEIQKVTEAKLEAIDKNKKLSEKEKIKAKAEVAKAAIAVVEAINEATDQATVDAKVTEGTKAISSVAEVGKDQAKAAIDLALSAKETAIDSNDKLSDAEKSAAKAAAKKAAEDVKKAIESATTQAEVDAKVTEGTQAISSVAEVGKDKAKAAVDSALSAKETAIDNNEKLSDTEKSAAKAAAKKAAEDAKKAIDSATTQAEVDEAKTTGMTAISAVNPVGKEKALAEIDTALAEKAKAIDARTDLLTAEKTTAKKAAESAAETAKDAIRKAMSQDDVAKVTEVGKANIAKIDPVGAKAEFKKAVEEVLADKLKEIDARTDLTLEEKDKKKESVREEAEAAKKAIDNSTIQAELDKALRTFLYQVDQDALVADLPELKLEDALKALINGVVKVERGKALSQADVLAKLDLPEEISVIKMVLPDTNTVGTKVATVTLRLADGSVQKLEVPVEVISPNNQDMIPPYNGGNYGPSADNGMTNTQAKVNKAKLEGAIHQLDELIIKESAKLDAETAKEANDLLADAKKVFANADASQAEVDAMVKRIEDFMAKVAPSTDHATPANDQAAQTPAVAPANAQAAANAGQTASAQANARKVAKELPNTGTADSTVAMVAAAASALLGLGLGGRRRKEDEEA